MNDRRRQRGWGAAALGAALLLLGGCDPDGPTTSAGGRLEVRAPIAGLVAVGDRAVALQPLVPAVLEGVGPGPYVVDFQGDRERVTVLDVPGPVVDLGLVLGAGPAARGTETRLHVEAPDAAAVLLVADGRRAVGVPDGQGGWRVDAPRGVEADVLAWWPGEAVGRRRLGDPAAAGSVLLAPDQPLVRTFDVTVLGDLPGHARVELTVGGVRTGWVLGEGAVGQVRPDQRVALRALVPPMGPVLGEVGLWVEGQAVEIGGAAPQATRGVHLPLDASGHTLTWAAPLEVAPGFRAGAQRAFFGRPAQALRVGGPTEAVTWLEVQLIGDDGCDRVRWRVVAPAQGDPLTLPRPGFGDPLAMPRVEARVALAGWDGVDYADLFASGAADALAPGLATRATWSRAADGAWRGGSAGCTADDRQGLYAAYDAAAACRAGESAPRALVDRCGAVVGDAPLALCGQLIDDTFVGLSAPPAPVEQDVEGALSIARAAGTVRLEPLPARGDPPPRALLGRWSAFEGYALREAPDGTRDDEVRVAAGGGEGGPWLVVDADGWARLRTPDVAFDATVRVDAEGISLDVAGAGCADVPRALSASLEGEVLTLRETVPTREGGLLLRRIVLRR
ncbi:MAG: hypothetical protein H6704_19000 [Myxococcales bacterium]|nr:hypothetical protein [Myxococcales bacterium]